MHAGVVLLSENKNPSRGDLLKTRCAEVLSIRFLTSFDFARAR